MVSNYTKTQKFGLLCLVSVMLIIVYVTTKNGINKHIFQYGKCSKCSFKTFNNVTVNMRQLFGNYTIDREVIHIATTVCGLRIRQAVLMMWTATIFTEEFLHFHIVCSSEVKPIIKKQVSSWSSELQRRIAITLYNTWKPPDEMTADGRDMVFPKAMRRKCTTQRLFIPNILNDVDRVLYLDTDVLLLHSVREIWKVFQMFNASQMAAMVREAESGRVPGVYSRRLLYPIYPPSGLNAGVALLDLRRFRSSNWKLDILKIYKLYYKYIVFSDQDIINIYFAKNPDRMYVLPCGMNYRPSHCRFGENCLLETRNDSDLIVYHGNSDAFARRRSSHYNDVFFNMYKVVQKVFALNLNSSNEIKQKLYGLLSATVEIKSLTDCDQLKEKILTDLKNSLK